MTDDPDAAAPRPASPPPPTPSEPADVGPLDDWTVEDLEAETARTAVGLGVDEDAAPVIPATSTWLPWLEGRSSDVTICPFLRALGADDQIGFPVEAPDVANRCGALRGDAVPQSLRQQELVCLTRAHVDCPRYLRGAIVASEVPAAKVRARTQVTPAIAAALIILALSFTASVAFGLANGGLLLPSGALLSPGPSSSAAVVEPSVAVNGSLTPEPSSGGPTPAPTSSPASPGPTPTPGPTGSPTPEPSASPVVTPAPTPTGEPTPAPTVTPKPGSNRFDVLTPCPGTSNCYIYRIRSGDNLFSIAKYFGVSIDRVRAMNPWVSSGLKVGRELRIPTPTR